MRRACAGRPAGELHHLGRDAQQPGQAAQQLELSGPVGADQRADLAGRDVEVDAEQRLEIALARIERMCRQQDRAHASIPM